MARATDRGVGTGSEKADEAGRGPSRGKWAAVIVIVAILIFLAYATYWGLEWYRGEPREVEVDPGDAETEEYELSRNQSDLVSRMGYPDSFFIMFFEDEVNGSLENFRFEKWTYYARSREYSFLNGELVSQNATDIQVGELVENPYRPEQFTEYMSLDEVIASSGIEKYLVVPMEEALVEEGEVFYADRLAFGLAGGELLYVESIAVEVED